MLSEIFLSIQLYRASIEVSLTKSVIWYSFRGLAILIGPSLSVRFPYSFLILSLWEKNK